MWFFDTHCHIQFADYPLSPDEVLPAAHQAGVTRMLAVGCTLADSEAAIPYAAAHEGVWASAGLHPHEAIRYVHDHHALQQFRELVAKNHTNGNVIDVHRKLVAIGETGLDYHYDHSSKSDQKKLFRFQLDIAQEFDLPLIFHVREAFADFWKIFDGYKGVRGVVHSFSSQTSDLENILSRGLYVGLNGIMTFTKFPEQLEAAKAIPLNRLLLETDAPYLTPVPFRGKICEPKHVATVGRFLAELRAETIEDIANTTTQNALQLFRIKSL